MADEVLNRLKKKRTNARTSITKTIKNIETEINNLEVSVDVLEELLEHMGICSDELKAINTEIESAVDLKDLDNELKSATEYQSKIITWTFRTKKKIRELSKSDSKEISTTPMATALTANNFISEKVSVKLPKLTINHFYGDNNQWLTFWNTFEAAIHKNESLDKISKFSYLKTYLKGSALKSVEGLAITPENYDTAIDILLSRFGKKNILINTHMNSLLQIPPLKNARDPISFRRFFDQVQTEIRSLESLGINSDTFGSLLTPMLIKLLPTNLIFEFNKQTGESDYDLKQMIEFLSLQLSAIERSHISYSLENNMKQSWRRECETPKRQVTQFQSGENKRQDKTMFTATDLLSVEKREKSLSCIFCDGDSPPQHESSNCEFVHTLPIQKRKDILMKNGYCFRCIKRANHLSKACRAQIVCKFCSKNHSHILCYANAKEMVENRSKALNSNMPNEKIGNNVLANNSISKQVFLQTLVVCMNVNGLEYYTRILIDSGSVKSYVSKFMAKALKFECLGEETVVHGLFGGIEKKEQHKKYRVNISNIDKSFSCELDVMDQEKICVPIPKNSNSDIINKIKQSGIFVSDISINENTCMYQKDPNEVHMLIGADFAGRLFTGKIKQISEGLVAMHTRLGWALMGVSGEKTRNCATLLSLHINELNVTELWQLDTIGIRDYGENRSRKELEEATKLHFLETVKRDKEGRYMVNLPWIKDHPPLASCKKIAEKRLVNCIKSLEKIDRLHDYENVFKEWEDEDIIEKVDICQEIAQDHYLPHRPVFKENSTTKVRPVFDGSAKEKNFPSINECLEKGPNLIELIPSIINRFRFGRFGVIADIKKAFLQIGLQENDRPFLKFLWRKNGKNENLTVYQHKRVVFGISSSPFLLGATLEFHLKNVPGHYWETAHTLLKSFYVDNLVCSVNTIEELNKLMTESQDILAEGKFELRGWEHTPTSSEQLVAKQKIVPVLGLNWKLNEDSLTIDLKSFSIEETVVTKRKILSAVHRIFDPIGFTCPVTLLPKLLIQECWKNKVAWDTEVPVSIKKKYEKWKNELINLQKLEIPRCLFTDSEQKADLSLHVFCDASKLAYATCVFLRCQNDRSTTCQLIQARCRVVPLKQISIPRLELLACSIGARLVNTVKSDMNLESVPTTFWTDSMNALWWITKNDNWATFVYNRVQEIRELSKSQNWRHIAGSLNPADLPSRGCSVNELLKSRWWEGPSWLVLSPEEWPVSEVIPNAEVVNSEKRKTVISATNFETDKFKFFNNISSFSKITRIIAYVLRFCRNLKRGRNIPKKGKLEIIELQEAEKFILKKIQLESFYGEKPLKLRFIKDNDGLLRVETRVALRKDLETFRFPILLPSKHPLVEKLILEKHIELKHAGTQILMTNLREYYWIIKSRKTIRQVIRSCVKCKRFSARPLETVSIPLPEDRVRDAAIFEVCGVDLCGPLFLKKANKCWVVLFTCAIYRAIHLELVTSLSSDSFILAVRRFIARRGRPITIYSDNGTNFVGTNNELKAIDWNKIEDFAIDKRIQWKFSPPSAPWWGGFWERLVGMLKNVLRKVLGRACCDEEELVTILCDAESLINSRPLTYLSEETTDLVALSPSMFLQEIKEVGVPDFDLIDSMKLEKRFIYRMKVRQDLRNRFRNEYLGLLKDYSKVRKESSIKEGDVVLIGDNDVKRINWPLAKVLKTYPGKDGRIRVVEVKTRFGTFIRPIQRLYPLEVNLSDACSIEKRILSDKKKNSNNYSFSLRTNFKTSSETNILRTFLRDSV